MERFGLVAENAWHVLPHDPLGSKVIDNTKERQRQVAARVIQTLPQTGHGVALTRRASYQQVDVSCLQRPLLVLGHVPVVLDVEEAVGKDG